MVERACASLIQSISEYIDGTLDAGLCQILEEHMKGCENCQIVYNTTLKTIDLYRACGEQEELPGEVRARLYLRLNLADYIQKDVPADSSAGISTIDGN